MKLPYPDLLRRHVAEVDDLIREAIINHDGNRTRAAAAIGMDRSRMCRTIREHGIDVPPAKTGRKLS